MSKNIVTLFKSVKSTATGFNRDVLFALARIKTGSSKDIVELIRSQPKDKHGELKQSLPGVCFNGSFKYRSAAGLISHSGLIILDFDGFLSIQEAKDFKQSLFEDPYVFSCWISPSGLGVKVLVKIPADEKNHKGYFTTLKKHFNSPNFDDSGSDVSRFCYESYDEDLHINHDSDLWTELEEPEVEEIGTQSPTIAVTSENRIVENLLIWWEKKYGATKGSRNNNVYKLAIAFNDFGIQKSEAENILQRFSSDGFNINEINNIIKSAYKNQANFGTKFFEDNQTKEKIEKLIRAGKSQKEISKSFESHDKKEVENFVSSIKETLDIDEYWYYDDKNKIKLSIHKFKFWLEQNNFYKYYPSPTSGTFTFIKKEQNLLEETTDKRIKDYVLQDILNRPHVGFGPYDFMAANSGFFKPDFLSMLDTTEVNLKEDDKNHCYLYYKNCVIQVTKDNVKQIDYIDVDGLIWKRQIIDRDYVESDHHNAIFRKFLWLVSGKDMDRYNSFKSVVGYLLHSYKNSANNKAIIFNDETISENPNGGSGKGLFWNALKNMKKVSSIDGKTFEFTKSFPYQTVSTDTQILVFDDVKKNFNFESLFSLITEGITLEYKGQDAIQIPVEKSPKILITTNYTVGGVGGSFERRKFEVEMSDYFSSKHTPFDEFGHMLFSDWDDLEWQRFDNFMINCCQFYLKNGLVKHEFHNLDVRKFIKETSYEFYEWSKEEDNLPVNSRLDKKQWFEAFVSDYQDYKKWLTQRKFSKWLEIYAGFYNYNLISGRTNSLRWIEFETENKDYTIINSDESEPVF